MTEETFVLIVGGGPVGLSAALELQDRGVPAVLVTANLETARHPKCNLTNARSMEHFRRLGLADELRSTGLPADLPRESAYVTRFCGHEFGRLPRPLTQWPTPELPNFISQIRLEEKLRRAAEIRGADLRFGRRLISFTQDDESVEAIVEDVTSGERSTIRARYLLAADGATSAVRAALAVPLQGEAGDTPRAFMGGTMLSYFIEAPTLFAESGRKPSHMTWIINRELRAMMYSQDGRRQWVVHYQVPDGVDWRALDPRDIVRRTLGSDTPFEILSGGPWRGGLGLVAERFRVGRAFLAGDAAHLFTPLGGFGMNTGLGDVMNLGWKLGAVAQGWAPASLLDSYEAERRPVALRNVQLGIRCTEIMDGWRVPETIEDTGAAGEAARRSFGEQVVREDRVQYHTIGLQLGERYADSPIVVGDGEPVPEDSWEHVWPAAFPGSRAPHILLEGTPLLDRLRAGLTILARDADADAARFLAAARERGAPAVVVALDEPSRAAYPRRLTVVRPDQHVAWHGDAADEAGAILDRIRGVRTEGRA